MKHSGNITLEEVINIAKIMRPRSMAKKLEGTVKEVLGTAQVSIFPAHLFIEFLFFLILISNSVVVCWMHY